MPRNSVKNAPGLPTGQILVWTAALDDIMGIRFEQLARLLSRDENQRALRFHFERDRKRFIVCRGILREILGTYLQRDPEKIDFNYGPQGKPYLNSPEGQTDGSVYFNVSHSSGWAIYALGLGEVGVDLEFVKPLPEMQALVDQHFSVAERRAFSAVPSDQKLKAFYNCWTRKEAYVKALGGGLRGLFIALILQLKRSLRWSVQRTTSRAFAVSGPLDDAVGRLTTACTFPCIEP